MSGIDVFEAIKKLDVKHRENYIIASMGFNIDFYMRMDKHENEFAYKEDNIYTYLGIKGLNMRGLSHILCKR